MPPIITLLTDLGLADSYVAEMKAALLTQVPHAVLVDITHEVLPGDVRAAQCLVERTWRRFPPGTAHLVVVDPGVGSSRRALAGTVGGQAFVGPDNGVLTPMLEGAELVALRVPTGASATFHGRDVFAPAAAALAAGEPLAVLGTPLRDPVLAPLPSARLEGGVAVGEVLYVDRFGTLVTNLSAAHAEGRREVVLEGVSAPICRTFSDVQPGAFVAFVGSGGTVEIAVRDGSASGRTGVGVGAPVRLLRGDGGGT